MGVSLLLKNIPPQKVPFPKNYPTFSKTKHVCPRKENVRNTRVEDLSSQAETTTWKCLNQTCLGQQRKTHWVVQNILPYL